MTLRTKTLTAMLIAGLLPVTAAAQQQLQRFTVGGEFQVNSYTTAYQYRPRVAVDARGNSVVVWTGNGATGPDEIYAQRFSSLGTALGTEFRVNTYTTNGQYEPRVAADPAGDFIVVWQSDSEDGDGFGIYGQRYASSGAALGTEFRINTTTVNSQQWPNIATDDAGNFVVVWHGPDADGYGVFGQRFTSAGAPAGTEFQVNSYTLNNQYYASVGAESNGDFVVVWGSNLNQDGDGTGVFGQRYASSGATIGREFQVNSYTTGYQGAYANQAVSVDADGDFVVVWNDYRFIDGDVFGRRFASSGAALGTDFLVNAYTTGIQGGQAGGFWLQSAAGNATGDFMVVWTTDYDGDSYGAHGQAFRNGAGLIGSEFQVNTYTTDDQRYPTVGANAGGDFVVVWQSKTQDGSNFGVFGQRYVLAYEDVSQFVGAGGSFGTDTGEGDGATSGDPVETTVQTPNAGTVTVIERPKNGNPPFGLTFLGQAISIEAPAATAATPLKLTFEFDVTLFRGIANPTGVKIYRNNVEVPNCTGFVTTCTGGPTSASPDPCVANRCLQTDSDVQITILTSAASEWSFATDCSTGFAKGILNIKEKSPGHEKLVAKLLGGPMLTQADLGNPLLPDGPTYRLRIYDDAQKLVGEVGVNRPGDTTCSGGATACWKSIGGNPPNGRGYKYSDTDRSADGLAQVQLKSTGSGAKFLFKAKGPVPPFTTGVPAALTSTTAVTMEVHADNGPAPGCYSVTLPVIKTQDPDAFKAKK